MTIEMQSGSMALEPALSKLVEAVQDENTVLREQRIVSHAGFADRKNQALRELMAVQKRDVRVVADDRIKSMLKILASGLQENARLLKQHISVVGEISDIIVGSLKEAESDGTYSRGRIQRRG
jgi:hypothetical protein